MAFEQPDYFELVKDLLGFSIHDRPLPSCDQLDDGSCPTIEDWDDWAKQQAHCEVCGISSDEGDGRCDNCRIDWDVYTDLCRPL